VEFIESEFDQEAAYYQYQMEEFEHWQQEQEMNDLDQKQNASSQPYI